MNTRRFGPWPFLPGGPQQPTRAVGLTHETSCLPNSRHRSHVHRDAVCSTFVFTCPEHFTGDYVQIVTDSRQLGFELEELKKQENGDERKRRDRGLSREYAVHEQLIKRSLQSFCLPAEKRA
jgi:hypothetical protein